MMGGLWMALDFLRTLNIVDAVLLNSLHDV